jgi:hypothetical protein
MLWPLSTVTHREDSHVPDEGRTLLLVSSVTPHNIQYIVNRELCSYTACNLASEILMKRRVSVFATCYATNSISSRIPGEFKNLSIISVHKMLASSDINHGCV